MEVNKVYCGDCQDILKTLPENSVDSICCDPPYELGFMGKSWDSTGIANNVELWKECLRVLKPGGHLLAFSGTRTYHRMASAIEDAGFEVRDMIEWVYGCLSFDTEVLTKRGFRRLHKLTQYDRIAVYDIEKNIYKWERPQRWSIYEVHKDTAYRIKSDYTDQVVSRNHRCLVEREGKLVFIQAEELNEVECMPTLQNNFFALQKGYWKLLLSDLLWKSKGLAQKVFSKRTGQETSRNGIEGREEPSVERGSDLQKEEGKVCRPKDKICEMPTGVSGDGEKGRVCDGTQIESCTRDTKTSDEDGVCSSHQSRCNGQQDRELDTIQDKRGTQEIRTWATYNTTLATVEKIEYSGIIFCPTVSTGAFVARRNGQVFITGNSGFPKSLNIGKKVDELQGNEREKSLEKGKKFSGSNNNLSSDGYHLFERTKGTSEWEGWGTSLKPSHESIMLAQKPLTAVPLFDKIDIELFIKTILCQLVSFVRTAESNSVLSQKGLSEELDIAQWIAEDSTNIKDALSVLMDMCQLELTVNTNLNIVLLWLNILEDLYYLKSKFTTLTEISLTIELKILSSLAWQDIFQNIINHQDKKTDGQNVNVLSAVNLFNAVRLKLNHILTHFAQDPAILKDALSDIRPNHEPICMARKPLSEKTVAENVLKWRTGGINIDESRVGTDENLSVKAHNIPNGQFHYSFGATDWEVNKNGRFPANLIHDNSEEVRECFPETKSGGGEKRGKTYAYFNEATENKQDVKYYCEPDSGNASRFFKSIIYQAKASKSERNMGCEGLENKPSQLNSGGIGRECSVEKRLEENGENAPTMKNNHPTVKPIALMEYLIKMVTPKGGIVLDPFAGSGSTLVAAKKNDFNYIGIELTAEYIPIIEARLSAVKVEQTLFN